MVVLNFGIARELFIRSLNFLIFLFFLFSLSGPHFSERLSESYY